MTWHVVAESWMIEEGKGIEVVIDTEVVAIFRSDQQLFALEAMCAHQGGPLAQGKVADGCVTCPWHGWQYELRNGNNAMTCRPMLRTYDVRECEGIVEVELL